MWIETKNGLPKTSESEPSIEVAVTINGGDENFSSALTFEAGVFKMDNGVDLTSDVIAWQYLPQPFNDIKPAIEIKAGVYCDDIKTEEQYINTCKALIKLGADRGEYSEDYVSYCIYENVGWAEHGNRIYHAGGTEDAFTTRVSYKDIIAAAKAMEG